MRGVILAAGDGGRLRSLTMGTPKVLLEIGGVPLIQYSIDALRIAGIHDIGIVVGYQSDRVLDALTETHPYLTFIYNEDYEGGNAISIYSARTFVANDPFVVCMGDHPIGPEIIESLLSCRQEGCVLCVDLHAWHPSQISDATRVQVSPDGTISRIGKGLGVWNAIDTGVFRMTEEVFPAMERLIEGLGAEVTITDVVRSMAANGRPFSTCDVSGYFWADVDTPEDYRSTDRLLRLRDGERV